MDCGNLEIICSYSPSPPLIDLSNIQWDDVLEDIEGKATCVLGVRWDGFSSKQLRTICSHLAIKGVKNAKKSDMVESLDALYDNKKAYLPYKVICVVGKNVLPKGKLFNNHG